MLGQDYQYYFRSDSNFAESPDAYYFLGPHSMYLMSKNKKNGETAVLCNKADCLHDKEEDGTRTAYCNAMLMGYQGLQYYNNKLYSVSNTSTNKNPSVIEISTDGSGYRKILEPKNTILAFVLHRGYLYISYSDFLSAPENTDKNKLSSMRYWVEQYDLKNPSGSSKTIYEKKGVYGQINTMSAYGNSLYFQASVFKSLSDTKSVSGENFIYNTIEGSTISFPFDTSSSIAFADQKMFFYKLADGNSADYAGSEMLVFDKQVKQVGTLPIDHIAMLISNGSQLFADNQFDVLFNKISRDERAVKIYDTKGKLLHQVSLGNKTLPFIGANQDYYFYLGYPANENDPHPIYAINLHDLDNPDLKGELFYEYISTTNFPGVSTK